MPPRLVKFEALSKDSGSMDGLNAHCVIIDELHGIKDRNLYEVMKQSQSARRQPLLIMITTAGTVRECIFDDMYAYACNVVDGVFPDETFLPVLYELDRREEWTQPEAWAKANPALGTIKKAETLKAEINRAQNSPNDLRGLLVKNFNIRETLSTAWLNYEDLNNEDTFDIESFRGAFAIGGADLSRASDLTCATLLIIDKKTDRRFVTHKYTEVEYHEKSKGVIKFSFNQTPQRKDRDEIIESLEREKETAYNKTLQDFRQLDRVIQLHKDRKEFAIIRMYYFRETLSGEPRPPGEEKPTLSDIAVEIGREEKTLRRWRKVIISDMAVCLFGFDALLQQTAP